jgi:DNA-binding transcriptional regulator YiaG
MTPAVLHATLGRLGMRQVEAARLLGVDVGTVSRWVRGVAPMPVLAARLLTVCDECPAALGVLRRVSDAPST